MGWMQKNIDPPEIHLPGHNFTGPFTRLQERLNEDLTPKECSKPINRVDEAAYRHDIAYLKNMDTRTRLVYDQKMISELDNIQNPSTREKIERAVVKPILKSKVRFGLGVSSKINMEMYCVKCKAKTDSLEVNEMINKKGRPMLTSTCAVCGIKKYRFLKKIQGEINEKGN